MWYRIFLTALTLVLSAHFATAKRIKIGGAKTASGGPAFIAIDKGYFAAEGLDAQDRFLRFGTTDSGRLA